MSDPFEVDLVTGDGCDGVSWTATSWDDAIESLRDTAKNHAEQMTRRHLRAAGIYREPGPLDGTDVRVSDPVDGHGIIYSVWDARKDAVTLAEREAIEARPDGGITIDTEFRYHIHPLDPDDNVLTERECAKCGDSVLTLSSRDWCDGCEAEASEV